MDHMDGDRRQEMMLYLEAEGVLGEVADQGRATCCQSTLQRPVEGVDQRPEVLQRTR